jgi:hypothetical protein
MSNAFIGRPSLIQIKAVEREPAKMGRDAGRKRPMILIVDGRLMSLDISFRVGSTHQTGFPK